MQDRKPVSEMSAAEFADLIRPLPIEDLRSIVNYLSCRSPQVIDEALHELKLLGYVPGCHLHSSEPGRWCVLDLHHTGDHEDQDGRKWSAS